MEYNKLSNQEIVDKIKVLQIKYEEIKKDISEKMEILDIIEIEYKEAEETIKKRLKIK